ncbi:MAG: zinc ABC transporter substrate-binding protein [Thermoflexales bacterium]|nr:zinc ABC transporter substrate-binding protein [Thermoflexales bacterium]
MFRTLRQSGLLVCVLVVLGLAGCSPAAAPSDKLQVTVSVAPQQYFVERIGGEHVEVNVMVPTGRDPHSYEPKPDQLRALSASVAYFSIGVTFEKAWLDKIVSVNPRMALVDTTRGIERMPGAHQHEEGGGLDADEELDEHIWTSPELVKIQAQTIAAALVKLDPEHGQVYGANLKTFQADIDVLEADIRDALEGVQTRKFMVFHPAWGYFARDFGLEQISVEVGGQEPSAQELANLIREAKAEGIQVIFAQPEFSAQAAETIAAEIGGKVLLISPLAPDWLDNMRRVVVAFSEVMGKE